MSEFPTIERRTISDAILKGTKFLLSVQNDDGGIEFEDEKSERSGIWVTAETLEFFLTSQVVPITICEKVIDMINFLLNTQNVDGSWNMLVPTEQAKQDSGSIITTGHCIYVLRLAISDEYMPETDRISNAILKAEKWLLNHKIEKGKKIYWVDGANVSATPDKDVTSRMETIFISFYALMGLVPSTNGFGKSQSLSTSTKYILKKVAFFFEEEAKWFINQYQNNAEIIPQSEYPKILSTLSRITNAIFTLDNVLSNNLLMQVKDGLLSIISRGRENACFTTTISIGTLNDPNEFNKTYNNNTPFDVSMILLKLEDKVQLIVSILKEYIDNQMSDGSWFLNFCETYKVKTWTTSEALMCLEQAFEKYDIIATDGIEKYWKQKVSNIHTQLEEVENEKNDLMNNNEELCNKIKKIETKGKVFTVIIFSALIVGCFLGVKWIMDPTNTEKPVYILLVTIIIPIVIGVLSVPLWNLFVKLWNGLINIIHKNIKAYEEEKNGL